MFAPVVTRFVTYSIPVPRFAAAYMEAILDHAWMQEWIEAAQEEPWVIEQYEAASGVGRAVLVACSCSARRRPQMQVDVGIMAVALADPAADRDEDAVGRSLRLTR